MSALRSAGCALLALGAVLPGPPAGAVDEPPASPPPGARFATGTLGFRTDGLGFRADGLGFRSEPLVRPARESRSELVFELAADVLFDFDRAELRPEAEPVLRALLDQVKAKLPRPRFRVEGHTDAKGEDAYNQKLSERRAASVRDWLVRIGKVDGRAIATTGFGESRPVAPNTRPDGSDDPVGRQKNRRVVITVAAAP